LCRKAHSHYSLSTFLLVWFGQFVSLLGSGLTEFALGVWVYQKTGSATQFALTFLFLALPRIHRSLGSPVGDAPERSGRGANHARHRGAVLGCAAC
jgi:hypothetical protein